MTTIESPAPAAHFAQSARNCSTRFASGASAPAAPTPNINSANTSTASAARGSPSRWTPARASICEPGAAVAVAAPPVR